MKETLSWVVLTQGTRPDELRAAVESVSGDGTEVIVVFNGTEPTMLDSAGIRVLHSADNLGVPGGRDLGLRAASPGIIGFLDDDARLVTPDARSAITAAFERSPSLGAVSLRIVDEAGDTARRHVPRLGARAPSLGGRVATFLGGACAIRSEAYLAAGRYWSELFYAHEELDLAWRLYDTDYFIDYLAEVVVRHPRMPISRHADGWGRTGRNRVLVARRNLPWSLVVLHSAVWLLLGLWRAPDRVSRRAYVRGWQSGWSIPVPRRSIRWATVWRLTRVGRPPIL